MAENELKVNRERGIDMAYKAVDRVPRFIASAKGDRITDVDGNEMIDYICSWGPGL